MRAVRLHTPQPIAQSPLLLETVDAPEPRPNQIRLRVAVCGVCHTDLHTAEGDLKLPRLPIIPGHQVVGVVEQAGEGAGRFQVGDRVGVGWLNWTCGVCDFCRNGQENLCLQAQFTGLDHDGGYAAYMVVDERFAYGLPAVFSDTEAAPLLCAGIIGYRSLKLSGIRPGGRLGLFGFGASAHLAIQVARYWDCEVYVFTRGAEHRRLAEELGAVWTGGAEDRPPAALDAAITFAPVGWLVPLALGHLRPGGTLAINAVHLSPIPELDYSLIYGERVVRSVANFTRRDAEAFLSLAAEIPIRTEVEVFPLAEANVALQRLQAGQIRGAAVLTISA
jgi:alcohol dehydrogenase, propanol-preferring